MTPTGEADAERGDAYIRPSMQKRGSALSVLVSSSAKVATDSVGVLLYGKQKPSHAGWKESGKIVLKASWLNILVVVIPFAWASHWMVDVWGHEATFLLCFISIVPLQNIFDWCGEQVARHTEKDLGDFLAISFKNCVEATLAAILLRQCQLRLLQSTVVGVVILHLLLVPGTAFFIGGSQTFQQILHPHHASLNPSLLMTGVLTIMLPTAFFAALDRGEDTVRAPASEQEPFSPLVSDFVRDDLLKMSRGIAVMALLIYVASRIYRHIPWPPWHQEEDESQPGAHSAHEPPTTNEQRMHDVDADDEGEDDGPLVHPVVCAMLIVVSIGVMAVTAEFLVESIDPIRERSGINAEWFGLILLPLVSFSPEAAVAFWSFIRQLRQEFRSRRDTQTPPTPVPTSAPGRVPARNSGSTYSSATGSAGIAATSAGRPAQRKGKKRRSTSLLAHGRPIDLSIQFTLWWMPLLVLFAWWTEKPLHLLFDYFEVALLFGSCFLVNYVTADGKTNFAEGVVLVTFYAMIATAAWFYPGQPQVAFMLSCPSSVARAIADGLGNSFVSVL